MIESRPLNMTIATSPALTDAEKRGFHGFPPAQPTISPARALRQRAIARYLDRNRDGRDPAEPSAALEPVAAGILTCHVTPGPAMRNGGQTFTAHFELNGQAISTDYAERLCKAGPA